MSTSVKIAWWAFALSLIWIAAAGGQSASTPEPTPTNCWSQYQTEEEAILNCENHDD